MTRILLIVLILCFLSEGLGQALIKKLNLSDQGFGSPLGFVALLGGCQLLYYPIQALNLPFFCILIATFLVVGLAFIYALRNLPAIKKQWLSWRFFIVLVCWTLLFCILPLLYRFRLF